jgi:hypothetical protein
MGGTPRTRSEGDDSRKPFEGADRDVTHVVIELFGGDNNLSRFVLEDLGEIAAGIQGRFSVLALADFANGGASVIEVGRGTGSRVLESWGEIDTGDPDTLARFISRALVTYANVPHRAIGFWDHGTGVFDEHDAGEVVLERRLGAVARFRRSRSMPARRLLVPRRAIAPDVQARAMLHDTTNGGVLTNREAAGMLKAAFARAGQAGPIDLIFSDTCLNGMIEVLEQLRDYASVVVGSEDLEPGDGWDYFEWFRRMSADPPADAATWGAQAVRAFEAGYRDDFEAHPCTLGAFRSQQRIAEEFKTLVERCDDRGEEGFDWLRKARDRSQAFANHDTYDIADFSAKLKQVATDDAVKAACDKVAAAFDEARVDSIALGADVAASRGLAFWFPNNRYAFKQVATTYRELEFHKKTGWADYLANRFGV